MNGNLEASDVACRMIASFSEHKLISIDYPVEIDNPCNLLPYLLPNNEVDCTTS